MNIDETFGGIVVFKIQIIKIDFQKVHLSAIMGQSS
jgi:hypothetical protein